MAYKIYISYFLIYSRKKLQPQVFFNVKYPLRFSPSHIHILTCTFLDFVLFLLGYRN